MANGYAEGCVKPFSELVNSAKAPLRANSYPPKWNAMATAIKRQDFARGVNDTMVPSFPFSGSWLGSGSPIDNFSDSAVGDDDAARSSKGSCGRICFSIGADAETAKD